MSPVDLRSDTLTQPGPAMRRAMAEAPVGDDVYGEDPTVRALEARAAELVGKEAALFVPSGTMANQLAVRSHTEPGDSLFAAHHAHVHDYEGGGAAALSGVQSILIGHDGLFDADDLRASLPPPDPHFAKPRLVCVENTHNRAGGRIARQSDVVAVGALARERGLALHLDGARLFNAAVASGEDARTLAEPFDSVSFCLSKGLGAPVGSLLCGDVAFVKRAHRFRKMFGGGMRQAGILAAAGLYALDQHIARLADDHARARRLADGIADAPNARVDVAPETNIVMIEVPEVLAAAQALAARGVKLSLMGPTTLRAVLHLDVDDAGVEAAIEALRAL